MAGSCEHGNGLLASVKCWEFFDWPKNCQLLKKYFSPWNYVVTYLQCDKALPNFQYLFSETDNCIYIYVLTFIGPCIANILAEYNQQDTKFHNFFISVRLSARFGRVFLPSSGLQNCTYILRYLSDQYLTLYVNFELLMMDEKPPETCRASYRYKKIVKCCILLVIQGVTGGMDQTSGGCSLC